MMVIGSVSVSIRVGVLCGGSQGAQGAESAQMAAGIAQDKPLRSGVQYDGMILYSTRSVLYDTGRAVLICLRF